MCPSVPRRRVRRHKNPVFLVAASAAQHLRGVRRSSVVGDTRGRFRQTRRQQEVALHGGMGRHVRNIPKRSAPDRQGTQEAGKHPPLAWRAHDRPRAQDHPVAVPGRARSRAGSAAHSGWPMSSRGVCGLITNSRSVDGSLVANNETKSASIRSHGGAEGNPVIPVVPTMAPKEAHVRKRV